MNIEYSKAFIKAATKLDGKYKSSLAIKIEEVKSVATVEKLTECKKLEGFSNTTESELETLGRFSFLQSSTIRYVLNI